jgi:hypothetical protein
METRRAVIEEHYNKGQASSCKIKNESRASREQVEKVKSIALRPLSPPPPPPKPPPPPPHMHTFSRNVGEVQKQFI